MTRLKQEDFYVISEIIYCGSRYRERFMEGSPEEFMEGIADAITESFYGDQIKAACDSVYNGDISYADGLHKSGLLNEDEFLAQMHKYHPDY